MVTQIKRYWSNSAHYHETLLWEGRVDEGWEHHEEWTRARSPKDKLWHVTLEYVSMPSVDE